MGLPKKFVENLNDILEFEVNPAVTEKIGAAEMEFSRMIPFPGHIFKLYEGQQFDDMVESIKQFGILIPIILWRNEDDAYIILSGHNRVNAGKAAGLTKGPVLIKDKLTNDEATLIVTETNLRQRSFTDLSHSERALCLAQHYEAIKCQGKRNDLINEIETLINPHDDKVEGTSSECQTKLRADAKIGVEYGLSRDKVAKYIRISTITPALLTYVDSGRIPFLAAYEVSFVEDKDKQDLIADIVKRGNKKIDIKMSVLLREYYHCGKLTEKAIEEILSGEKTRKPKSDKPVEFKLKPSVIGKYFTGEHSQAEIEDVITKALELYFSEERRDKNLKRNLTFAVI